MARALLYQSKHRWRFGIAFGAAALIHFSAIALAAIYQGPPVEEPSTGCDFPVVAEIATISFPDEPTPPPIEPEASPSPVAISESPFPEERRTPVPVRSQTTKLTLPFVRARAASAGSVTLSTAKAVALSAPRPEYPYEARRQGSPAAALCCWRSIPLVELFPKSQCGRAPEVSCSIMQRSRLSRGGASNLAQSQGLSRR